jgi:glycosyltransferase involved in cell wall biosynthesis
VVFLCGLISRKHRPLIFLDAFISLYDTAVIDRQMMRPGNPLAKILFWIERRAFSLSEKVITDTPANSAYLAELFDLPRSKFSAVSLASSAITPGTNASNASQCSCLFVGTFVPLQGVPTIVEAAILLVERDDIEIKIIGSGQDASKVQAMLSASNLPNVTLDSQWRSIEELELEITSADICLGIFGATAKTERVWPLKNYLYMSAGKAVISGDTSHARELKNRMSEPAFKLATVASAQDLAAAIIELADAPASRHELGANARAFYQNHLSRQVAVDELLKLLLTM